MLAPVRLDVIAVCWPLECPSVVKPAWIQQLEVKLLAEGGDLGQDLHGLVAQQLRGAASRSSCRVQGWYPRGSSHVQHGGRSLVAPHALQDCEQRVCHVLPQGGEGPVCQVASQAGHTAGCGFRGPCRPSGDAHSVPGAGTSWLAHPQQQRRAPAQQQVPVSKVLDRLVGALPAALQAADGRSF